MPEPVLRIVIPALPPREYSANSRKHWRFKRGKSGANNAALHDVWGLVQEQGWKGPALEKAFCRCVFHIDRRNRDHGSLIERMKPIWDALVHCQVLADDNLKILGWPDYSHEYRRPDATVIEVYRA